MRSRIRSALTREVTMPPWAIALDFVYRAFLVVSAAVVIVLWWQAATRNEEEDRNARIQACASEYAATTAAWEASVLRSDEDAEALFARIIVRAAGPDRPDPGMLDRYQALSERAAAAAAKVDEMAQRRIGLARYAAESVQAGNDFACPPLTDRLRVEGIRPD